ncbi:MAG: SpoIIE family protein phosphatase [Clostridia bacterium]|nr:SpoIIE family protein phosphatase [Clostridia bacterium]
MRISGWLKAHFYANLCAFLVFLSSPLRWTSPFGVAYLAAAGHGELKWYDVFPGAALGAILGKGGLGGFFGGLMAYTLCGIFHRRDVPSPKSRLSLAAFACCLFPAYVYHLPYSAYDAVAATFASVIAMAACPAISPVLVRGIGRRMQLSMDERVAVFVLCAVMISGLHELYAPAGCFFAGLFALMLAFSGMFSSLIGALTAAVGLLLGSAGANECALVFLCTAAAGSVSGYGVWAQAGMFLIGIPLSAYLGFSVSSAAVLLPTAVYPWIPRAVSAQLGRYLGFYDDAHAVFLTANTSRRHIAPNGMKVCGDAGFVERLADGRMLFMLADGMGTGRKAREMSDRVIGYARDVFQSPLRTEDAVKCINALSEKEKDVHSTLDLCILDTITGKTEFVKNGAEPCWILSRYEVRRFEGEALPLGTLSNAPSACMTALVRPGDSIFMATDGLLNALGGADRTERLLFENKSLTPAALCAEMIHTAKKAHADLIRDDMSAMCIKIGGKSACSKAILHLTEGKEEAEKKAG